MALRQLPNKTHRTTVPLRDFLYRQVPPVVCGHLSVVYTHQWTSTLMLNPAQVEAPEDRGHRNAQSASQARSGLTTDKPGRNTLRGQYPNNTV